MCFIQIDIRGLDRFFEVLLDDLETMELNASRQDLRGNDTMGKRVWKSEEKEEMCDSPNHFTPVRPGNPDRAASTV
jgi:hypothetical protein